MKDQKEICRSKKRFPNKQSADKIIDRIWKKGRWDTTYGLRPTHSYKCVVCNNWHMTSQQTRIGN